MVVYNMFLTRLVQTALLMLQTATAGTKSRQARQARGIQQAREVSLVDLTVNYIRMGENFRRTSRAFLYCLRELLLTPTVASEGDGIHVPYNTP